MNAGALGRLLRPLSLRIRGVVARAVVRIVNDSLKCQGLQVQVLAGETRTIERFQEYGFSSVPLDGAEAVLVFVGGDRGHGIAVATEDRRYRPTDQGPGEVVLYTAEGDRISMKAGHLVEVATQTFRVLGNIEATGDVSDGVRSMEEDRAIFRAHVHGGVEPGSGTSGPPINAESSGELQIDFAVQAVEIPPELLTGGARALGVLRIRGGTDSEAAAVWISEDDADYTEINANNQYMTGGTLLEPFDADPGDIEDGPILHADGPDLAALLLHLRTSGWELGRQLLVVDGEWMFLRDAEDLGGDSWRLKGIKRGQYRTAVATHSTGTVAFIIDPRRLAPYYDPLVRDLQQVYVKTQPRSIDGAVALSDVSPAPVTFAARGPHDAQWVFREEPTGTIDGVNAVFLLAFEPSPPESLDLRRNGVGMKQGDDYTLSGRTITFAPAAVPRLTGSLLAQSYQIG